MRTTRITIACLVAASLLGGTLAALAQSPPGGFSDVNEGTYYSQAVHDLAADGVFEDTECPAGFCPTEPVDRKTMAVWIVRLLDGDDPSQVSGARFADVHASGFHAPFIDRMAELNVTMGCGDGTVFCPDDSVTRAQMAVFLSRAFDLADGPDPGFTDVPSDAWYASDVAKLAASKITAGCGDGSMFCPQSATTRAQMATFLWRALSAFPEIRNSRITLGEVDLTDLVHDILGGPGHPDELIVAGEVGMAHLVNTLRRRVEAPELGYHPGVAAVARSWSETMAEAGRGGFFHNPSYSAQYPSGWFAAAENIALYPLFGDEDQWDVLADAVTRAFEGLSGSPGHYRNMVNSTYNWLGVGLAVADGYLYVTQNFAYYPNR